MILVLGIVLVTLLVLTAFEEGRFEGRAQSQTSTLASYPGPDELRAWKMTIFTTAHADIQWAKDRAWAAVQSLTVGFGGLAAFGKVMGCGEGIQHTVELLIAIGVLNGVTYVYRLHRFAMVSRHRAHRLLDEVAGIREYSPLPPRRDPHHLLHFVVKLLILGIAAFASIHTMIAACSA